MNYKIKFNNFLEFLELKSIIVSKNRFKKNKKAKLFNYMKEFYSICVLFVIVYCLTYFPLSSSLSLFVYLSCVLCLCVILSYLLFFLVFVIEFYKYKDGRSGKIVCNEDGIIDNSDLGYIYGCAWDKVDMVLIGKYNTVVFFNMPWCMYVNNKDNNKLIKEINKHTGIDPIYVKNEF